MMDTLFNIRSYEQLYNFFLSHIQSFDIRNNYKKKNKNKKYHITKALILGTIIKKNK